MILTKFMTYHKHQNFHKTIKFDPSNYLKLGELNKYVKIWEEMGVTRKPI